MVKKKPSLDPRLDLSFERVCNVPVEKIWRGWTQPKMLMKWFCPKPWQVTDCRISLKPGGEFYTLMQGPKGEKMHNHGCFLEVVKNKKLVWTGALTAGYRPAKPDPLGFFFVATIEFSKKGKASVYKVTVAHADEAACKKHQEMGFPQGWNMAFDQFLALYEK